jgi:predicted Zn-dependent peptidase
MRKGKNMKRLWLLALVAAILAVSSLCAARNLEDRVTEFDLRNGMKFIVVERHVAPVFFGFIVFNVGAMNEWDGVTGISHLLEHMMFKGTTTVGTAGYSKEKKYLEQEDEIAATIRELKRAIGTWRLETLNDFSRNLISSLEEDLKKDIGGDKAKELSVLVAMLESGKHAPPEAEQYPTLLQDNGVNYLDQYTLLKAKELELEHVMVEHRELIIKDELWDTYLQNGGRMLNAFTSNDITGYIVYLPVNRLELWAMLESDRMKDAIFREFYSERNVVTEERRLSENDPESVLYDALAAAAFQASPYGRPVLGWMSDLQSITREDIEAYFKQFYAPNNAVAVLVGDLDVDQVKRMARRYFENIPSQAPPEPVETIEPEQQGERRVTVEFDAEPQVMIAYHVPVVPNPDTYPLQVLKNVLGQGRTSRFYKTIYEDLELTSRSPSISFEPGERIDNVLFIHAYPRHPHTTEEVENAIYEEIEKIKAEPPTEREMQKIRNQIDANMVRILGGNLGLAFRIGFSAAVRGDWRAFLESSEKVKQVEPEQVCEVARKYLAPKNRTVATLVTAEKEEVEGEVGESEDLDFGALMQWIGTLPEDERTDIFQRMQTMTEEQRRAYAKELVDRMNAESK